MHAVAVQRWLDEFVVGMGFCPWAGTAQDAGGVRVVTTSAAELEGVMRDLVLEAKRCARAGGGNATTLLVCPEVKAWEDFRAFHSFFVWNLDSGFALVDAFGIKVVPFHPAYALGSTPGVKAGDVVSLPGPDGSEARCKVLAEFAGTDEAGESCMAVRFEGSGEEGLVRHTALLARRLRPGERGEDSDLASRSPRPLLHLLRVGDLDRALAEAGGDTTELLKRNEKRAQELGSGGVDKLLAECG